MKSSILSLLLGCACLVPATANAQVNSGSDGHDGAFNPAQNVEIDMADHPDGIYHYTSVNIPSGVTVTFKPNAKNTPVVWLVQGNCSIAGSVSLSGGRGINSDGTVSYIGAQGGPGGYMGGHGGSIVTGGQGPGGGGGDGSYGTLASSYYYSVGETLVGTTLYGNKFILPLLGGSGGGGGAGTMWGGGGGGGGGAILFAVSGSITITGVVSADGGTAYGTVGWGSGGAIRIISNAIVGSGAISAVGGRRSTPSGTWLTSGNGRIRFDSLQNNFGGSIVGSFSEGFQPIIIPASGQGVQLSIASIAGTAVSQTPSGVLVNPDVIIPAQQSNPLPVVVNCSNIPLNTEISMVVHPANGSDVQAVAINNAGTLEASTATVSVNMPRGGGIIYAKCVSGVSGLGADTSSKELGTKSLAETGWTADGERFAKMEITAVLGGKQQIAYLTEAGKRYTIP